MDLDGDGIGDIITGSWPGELYFFKGKGKGEFAAAVKLQDTKGKDIKLGSASTVFAADWRGTGKLDLLVGNIQGEVLLVPNKGEPRHHAFGAPLKLAAGGQMIKAGHGDSHPIAADWDRDGKLDLIVAGGDGSVTFYRNIGSKTEPKLAKGVTLVKAASSPNLNDEAPPPKEATPGMRAKICVVDWNGDGHLDLLLGDFGMSYGPKPKLTEADKKIEKEANARLQESRKKLQPFFDEYFKRLNDGARPDEPAEAKQEREKKAQEVLSRKEFQAVQAEQTKIYETIRRFQRPFSYSGNVWLYLRKPPAAAAR
ncbi:MAG: VCBS repeat-containing protein [Planctomycetes bacterium]|nr:VCBS repeat-containing protein [Planctomycetota bacterium]